MANYKVGDLEVTINGVSKDAVSSLDEVIKQLDTLQGKLGIVGKGFSGAFRNINSGAIRTVVQDFSDIQRATQTATESQREWNDEIINGARGTQQAFNDTKISVEEATEKLRRWQAEMRGESFSLVPYQAAQSLVAVAEAQESVNSSFERLNILLNMGTYSRLSSDVNNLATQWKNLYTTMQMSNVADKLTGGQFSAEAQNRLTILTQEYLNKKRAIDETNEAFKRMAMTEQELALYDYQQEQATRKQRIAYLNLMLTTKQAGERTKEFRKELRELAKQQEQSDKKANKSAKGGLSKFVGRIGRIGVYRMIRRGLQMITQTFTESIQAYAQVDDNINNMMSQLTSSTKIIQLSLGTTIFPILQAITPVVQQLSVGFANMANAINKSMALAQGNATYTKINTEALQDYRKELNKASGALFDFDKFRALSSKQDTASIFLSTEETTALDNAEQKYSSIFNLVSNLGDLLSLALTTIKDISEELSPIANFVLDIAGGLFEVLGSSNVLKPLIYEMLIYLTAMTGLKLGQWINNIGKEAATTTRAFKSWGIAIAAVTAAIMIISNWDEFSSGAKIAITVISGLTTALLGAATAAMALHGTLTLGTAIPLITAAVASGAIFIRGLVDIPKYATGASNIDGGAVFVAGEAGKTEMVYSGDNGKANVANVQQMYQADYMAHINALNEWWKTARYDLPQLQPASDTGIYQAAERGAGKAGKKFASY